MSDVHDRARQFARLLQRVYSESFELVRAAIVRLKRDHDGSFTRGLQDFYASGFHSEMERSRAIWKLIVDES